MPAQHVLNGFALNGGVLADAFQAALATPGLWMPLAGAAAAGLVRGFAGFGTALIYVPAAAQVLPPIWVLVTLVVMDIIGPIPAIPGALRRARSGELVLLGIGVAIGLPAGVTILTMLPETAFRYAASLLTLLLLAALMSGYRYRGTAGRPVIVGAGAIGGFMAGSVGLAGPPVIMLYMARPLPVAVIRANLLLFLVMADLLMIGLFAAWDMLELEPVMIGVLLILPYLVAVGIGTMLFDPAREGLYRRVAYVIIGISALTGLPLLNGG